MNAVMDADTVRRIADAELAPGSRIAHGLLLAASAAMTVVIVSLALTEPNLQLRTIVAFAVLAAIGAGWIGYALWVLTQRRVLYARQRVVAGWMAVTFTSVFTAGAFALGVVADLPAGMMSGTLGLVLVTASAMLLTRARQRLSALTARLQQLEAAR